MGASRAWLPSSHSCVTCGRTLGQGAVQGLSFIGIIFDSEREEKRRHKINCGDALEKASKSTLGRRDGDSRGVAAAAASGQAGLNWLYKEYQYRH